MDKPDASPPAAIPVVDLHSAPSTRTDAIECLLNAIQEAGYAGDMAELREGIQRREDEASTALPSGIALPHARLSRLTKMTVGMLRTGGPVDWQGTAVTIVFLVAIPKANPLAYLSFVQCLTRLLRKPESMRYLSTVQDEDACRRWLAEQQLDGTR